LGCGVEPAVPGFAEVDATGRHRGFDIDICRAVAAAVLGSADKVTYVSAPSVADFLRNDGIDLVSRRLTWELRREGSSGLLFGPITFFDGQGFLVSRTLAIDLARQLAGVPICVAGGSNFELNLGAYFSSQGMPLQKVVLESAHDYSGVAARLNDGRCRVYSGDLSDLGAIRSMTAQPDRFLILPNLISKEPLAPIVRSDDAQFFSIVRWTVFALISAEELGVTSANADDMRTSENLDVRRLLGVVPGNGNALGLSERWAYQAIKDVGNYGEIFDRNLGSRSRIRLDRGFNRLSRDGGLMYAPPLR
jgi:general L-amino acid transport system substrate-binding protein